MAIGKEIKIRNKENEFHSFFLEKPNVVLKGCTLLEHEFRLYPTMDLLRISTDIFAEETVTRHFGRIDFVFRWKQGLYVAEVKYYPYSIGEFWDAMKVLGYAIHYKFQTGIRKRIIPAILMPIEHIRLEHQHIASSLKIALFGIKSSRGKYELTLIGDEPYWRTLNKSEYK